MKVFKIFLPGKFLDAYCYMEKLVIITQDTSFLSLNLEELIQGIESKYENFNPIPRMLFLRNDWGQSQFAKGLFSNKSISNSLSLLLDKFPQQLEFDIENKNIDKNHKDLDIQGGMPLDITLYNQRLYIGATTGVYKASLKSDKNCFSLTEKPTKRLDATCVNISVKSGTIAASCCDDGLFTAIGEFSRSQVEAKTSDMKKLSAETSLRTEWFGHDLVNYASHFEPTLFHSTREKQPGSRAGSTITSIDSDNPIYLMKEFLAQKQELHQEIENTHASIIQPESESGYDSDSLYETYEDDDADDYADDYEDDDLIQYVYLSKSNFFIHMYDGEFLSSQVSKSKDGKLNFKAHKSYRDQENQILSVHQVNMGSVIESFNKIWLFSHEKWTLLVEDKAISVRTFPQSKRYQNLVSVTTEKGIFLLGLFDNSNFQDVDGNA